MSLPKYRDIYVSTLYMDCALSLNVATEDVPEAKAHVYANGRVVKGSVVNSPEAMVARTSKGLIGRRGLVLGVYKGVDGALSPSLLRLGKEYKLSVLHSAVRNAGWYDIKDELHRNTFMFTRHDIEKERNYPVVIMPGLPDDPFIQVRLGSGWGELRGTERAVKLLDCFRLSFHNLIYNW